VPYQQNRYDTSLNNLFKEKNKMKFSAFLIVMLSAFVLMACSPSAPESPDPDSYGTVIKPDHHIPEEHR